jgi:serine/threonine protein kinase
MTYLTDFQITELSNEAIRGKKAHISRNQSIVVYDLHQYHSRGMKGVVWRASDDLGNKLAIKIIPSTDYAGRSIIDEMTEASKLDDTYFASIKFFGDISIDDYQLSTSYKAVVTEWIDGIPFHEFTEKYSLSVSDFENLFVNLFHALACLRNKELCHDDLHPGNILVETITNGLTNDTVLKVKIIDTGTIKRTTTRDTLLEALRTRIGVLKDTNPRAPELARLEEFLKWKEPDDHLRIIESLLYAANALVRNYSRFDFWERKFIDQLHLFFHRTIDPHLERRLDNPARVVSEMRALKTSSKKKGDDARDLLTPFDYISAEMIRNDTEFAELFSKECPWLNECISIQPLYLYGPRGCGKSSVLRWLSFKTIISDQSRNFDSINEIGIYVSCSVELRSRFWLLDRDTIDKLQTIIIKYFNLLLLEELFDTLSSMWELHNCNIFDFQFNLSNTASFTEWVINRISLNEQMPRLQGQSHFEYLRNTVRKQRWDTWSDIQRNRISDALPDPSLISDICREIPNYFDYFKSRYITFLIDDYSNQRIPSYLQRKLNQTISFAKQGTPLFKVSSEYQGVDLEGIQEGREVIEVNIGEKYTALTNPTGHTFLSDIVNIRLKKAKYKSSIDILLGNTSYNNDTMSQAIANEKQEGGRPFYYHGINCIHWLCSGDIALALDLIKRIFDKNSINNISTTTVSPSSQHDIIQQFSHDEIRRIRYIVPYGSEMHNIVCYLGYISRVYLLNKQSERKDKKGEPLCVTHLDIRIPVIEQLRKTDAWLASIYDLITSRAILFSLETSRSRLSGSTERLQMRRIYFPAFKAPIKRDVPIKVDDVDNLKSLLSNPMTFAQRLLRKSEIDENQLKFAYDDAKVKPRVP